MIVVKLIGLAILLAFVAAVGALAWLTLRNWRDLVSFDRWWEVLDKYDVNLLVVEAEYSAGLRDELRKSPAWEIVVDETGDAEAKPNPLTRHLVAVRLTPRGVTR